MAEAGDLHLGNENDLNLNESLSGLECAVCLQPCVHPAQLPCQHIFCFLCIKGIAFQSGRCAMCREPIPTEFIFKPKLLSPLKCNADDSYQWYYEGGSGWWQYDLRASAEIEESFQKGEKSCNLLLAGFLYVIDFTNMVQYRQSNPLRRRKIKRDRSNTDKLGVAGLTENVLKREVDDIDAGMQQLWSPTSASSSRSVQPGAELVTSPLSRTDSENTDYYGLESLGPDEYPDDFGYEVVSPSMRDGRCFNPRLDLGESDDEESDEVLDIDDDEAEDVPRILGGPSVSPGTFRPLPMRAPGNDSRELSPRPENRQ